MVLNIRSQSRRQPTYRNIDGFIGPRSKLNHPYLSPHRPSQTSDSADNIPSMPNSRANQQNISRREQTLSLLNTTIPSGKISMKLPTSSRNTKRTKGKLNKRKILALSSLTVFILLIGVSGFLGTKILSTLDRVFHGNILSDIDAAFNNTPLKGENNGRVNILLAGDSIDDPGHGGGTLTDSILVLSIDTQDHSAFLLSIPRDLWVDIPGYGWQKINAANNNLGTNFSGYPQNGMGQLEHLVVTDLGIPIDYYALSDYGAFKDAVNAVGGVKVDIQSPDPRGLYDPGLLPPLPNGPVTLNGQTALDLARARGDQYGSYGFPASDFDRTEHQRQIFTAITQKAQTLGFLDNPVKISDLFSAFGNNVQTDLTLQNVLRLVSITKTINLTSVKSYSYCSTLAIGSNGCTNPLLTDYNDPASGEEALIPVAGIGNYGQLQQYYEELSSNNPIAKEGASVVIVNASDVVGLAKNQENILEAKGLNVATIADANNEHPSTMIVDNSNGKDPNTLKLLQQLYPGATVNSDSGSTEAAEAQGYNADFIIILGQNWDSSSTQ